MAIELQSNLALEATPTDPSHVVNVKYVQDFFAGKVKMPVRAVAASNLAGSYQPAPDMTLTLTAGGPLTIDGVALSPGDRVLLAGQTNGTQNGIYVLTAQGGASGAVLTRADDFNSSDKIYSGVSIAVNSGALFADTTWKLVTDDPITLEVTALTFINAEPAAGAAKYAETITGDSLTDKFTVTHNLGTTDVSGTIINLVTNAMVLTLWTVVDNNSIKVTFEAGAPTNAQAYRVVVIG